jgi:hypothetical protein
MKADMQRKSDGRNPRPERSANFEARMLSVLRSQICNLYCLSRVLGPQGKRFPMRTKLPNEANRPRSPGHGVPASTGRGSEQENDAHHFHIFALRSRLCLKPGLHPSIFTKRTHSGNLRIEEWNQRYPKIGTYNRFNCLITRDLHLFYQTKPCARSARFQFRFQSSTFPILRNEATPGR